MKKIVSLLLCLAIMATTVFCVMPTSFATNDGVDIPVIYIAGASNRIIRTNENGEIEEIFPLKIPEGYLNEKIKVFLPVFAKAFFTQKWDEFCDVLYEILVPIFEDIKLGKDGMPTDGSYVDWNWSKEGLRDAKQNGKYPVEAYTFLYDWRLDPWMIVDTLHQYIEDVKEVTGAESVALYGRCLGSNIAAAYMAKYDGEHVSEVIHYASAAMGAAYCSKAFCGELYLEPDGIERYVYDIDLSVDQYVLDLIRSFVSLLNKTYGLDIASWAVNNVYKDIYLDIVPRVLRESYGTFPSYWAMVRIEDYNKAKDTVFHGANLSEYADFFNKIDNYRNNVHLKLKDRTKAQMERGIEFSNIVKYGLQGMPIHKGLDEISDGTSTVFDASYGATTATVKVAFNNKYIEKAKANGTYKYISPDKQIDASTCLSPDTTWFVKDLEHGYFPACMNGLVSDIVNHDGFTVNDNPEYPQYMVFERDTEQIVPMTAENMNTTERWEVTFFDVISNLLKSLFNIIKQAVSK